MEIIFHLSTIINFYSTAMSPRTPLITGIMRSPKDWLRETLLNILSTHTFLLGAIAHVNDFYTFYKQQKVLANLIKSLEDEFRLTDKGDLKTFLWVSFIQEDKNALEINQPHQIESRLEALSLNDDAKMCDAPSNNMLHRDKDGKKRIQQWNHHSVVGI